MGGRVAAALSRYWQAATLAAAVIVVAIAVFAIDRLLADVSLRDVRGALHSLSAGQVIAAIVLTALSYLLLTLYDVLALRVIGRPLPWRTAALASFTSYALSHNLGLSLLTGGSARYRVYTASGLGGGDVARVVGLTGTFFWGGLSLLSALALITHSAPLTLGALVLSVQIQHAIALIVVLLMGAALVLTGSAGRTLRWRRWSVPLPSRRQSFAAIVLSAADIALACAVLFVLLPWAGPASIGVLFGAVLLAYCTALIAGMITHVPGGLGVFEAVMIAALPHVPLPELMAALIAYRAIYYLLPLALTGAILAVHAFRAWRRPVSAALDVSQSIVAGLAPAILAVLTFTGGVILLVSGSLPAIPARLQALRLVAPLPFVEGSHIAASLVGTALLLLAPGLLRRLDGAFHLTRALLVAGAVFSIVKGVDYEEAVILLAIAGLLHWSRREFYRHTALTVQIFSGGWIAACAIGVGLSVWIAFFAHKHIAYSGELWWQFAWHSGASRALRASLAASVLLLAAITAWLFGAPARRDPAGQPLSPAIKAITHGAARADAMLALVGDKRFLLAEDGDAFVMYQVQGGTWVVMGDPVGPAERWPDLLWRLREQADAAQGRLLLYQLSPAVLPLAIDLGLQIIKYGEEAHVDLADFSLDGSHRRGLRHSARRAIREGAEFEVVPAAAVPGIMADLRRVSDDWLSAKGQSEKAFSIGRFDPAYIAQCDCAIVRHRGQIVCFANMLQARAGQELSIDLMRHSDAMPPGGMDLLLAELMLWGRANGFATFNLGLAPLSGLESRRLATIWARAGAFLYRRGGSIYGFEGLRAFKEKFSPRWEPRYIAANPGIGLARALYDLQTLVSGTRASASHRQGSDADPLGSQSSSAVKRKSRNVALPGPAA